MKRLVQTLLASVFVVMIGFGATVPATVAADCNNNSNPLSCACGSGDSANSSDACNTSSGDPIGGPNGVLKKVSLIIAFLGGVAAVIVILIAGFMYITAGGDAQQTASARKVIIGAIVGLVIIASSESILVFVISKL